MQCRTRDRPSLARSVVVYVRAAFCSRSFGINTRGQSAMACSSAARLAAPSFRRASEADGESRPRGHSRLAGPLATMGRRARSCLSTSTVRCATAVFALLQVTSFVVCGGGVSTDAEFSGNGNTEFPTTEDVPPPLHVTVEARAEHSFTLCWDPPEMPPNQTLKLLAYSVTYMPIGDVPEEEEKELLVATNANTMLVPELQESTTYSVTLSAIYEGYRRSSAAPITVSTLVHVVELAVGDEMYSNPKIVCNCTDPGTVACSRNTHTFVCACYPAYTGLSCELCATNYFWAVKECKSCPCTNVTSSGVCSLDAKGQVTCTSCLPGHGGLQCTLCTEGYQWREDRCLPERCLGVCFDKTAPTCRDCIGPQVDNLKPTAHRSNSEQALDNGTIPLVAVLVTLSILAIVAASVSCYRYWSQRRTRPRLPFWSIELREDKMNLSSECHYQHLDAATSRVVQAQTDDTDPERPNSPSSPSKAQNTMNV